MRRKGNDGITNLNPYKTEYNFATEESRKVYPWEGHCYYRSKSGKCSNKKSEFYDEKCRQKHSCVYWTKESSSEKDNDVDERIYVNKNDYFQKIIRLFLLDKDRLMHKSFQEELKQTLLSGETEDNIQLFFEQLNVLYSLEKSDLPILECLYIERGGKYLFLQTNGEPLEYNWFSEKYRAVNHTLRIICYFCCKKKHTILKEWKVEDDDYFHNILWGETMYRVDSFADKINEKMTVLKERNGLTAHCNPEDKNTKWSLDYNKFVSILDLSLVAGEKYYNEKGKKAYLYSALIIPIHNYFYALEDVKYDLARVMDGDMRSHNYDSAKRINTLIYGKYVESETYGIGKIHDFSRKEGVCVEFLDFPHQKFYFDLMELFNNEEYNFVSEKTYRDAKRAIESYYRKKLYGKKVRYNVEIYKDDKYYTSEIKTFEGVVVGYANGYIKVSTIEDGIYLEYCPDKLFEYPPRENDHRYLDWEFVEDETK